MAKKYLEVFNDGTQDLFILDKDAQNAIGYDNITVEYVDLGLPSGTLWAKCNIGATEETGYGNYYMYGKGDREYIYRDTVYAGTEDPLAAEADTATVILGTPWHMPTLAQFEELVANTTFSWQSNFNNSGINGAKFTAQNGNYIFLPAVGKITDNQKYNVGNEGNYWSSTPGNSVNARSFNFGNNGTAMPNYYRSIGYAVRPVCDSAPLTDVKGELNNRYTKTEVDNKLQTKSNINHNHDGVYSPVGHTHDERYYQKSEVDAMVGLEYDAANRCVSFPAASEAEYNASTRSIDFPALSI